MHRRYLEEYGDIVIIHPDTWRDEYSLDAKTRELIPKTKRYVHITVNDDNQVQWKIVVCPVIRSAFHFDDVIRDEKKYLKMAAEEEGHSLKL